MPFAPHVRVRMHSRPQTHVHARTGTQTHLYPRARMHLPTPYAPQVPPHDDAKFRAATDTLKADFTFNELQGAVREVFDSFIQ